VAILVAVAVVVHILELKEPVVLVAVAEEVVEILMIMGFLELLTLAVVVVVERLEQTADQALF
jgi:hypothetical protein